MPNDSIQTGDVQGNLQLIQAAGDFHGDAVSRDKNVYHIQSLTIYLSSRPEEPEPKPISADIGPNPYKGLSTFQETDADRFFGREQLTRLLYEKFCALHDPTPALPKGEGVSPLLRGGVGGGVLRLLAVLGPSGSGKSSVVRAGLLPELARHPLPGKQRARVAVFTPGVRPLEALANILARMAYHDSVPLEKSDEFMRVMHKPNDQGVWHGLRRIADAMPEIDAAPLILLIDQFEELYTQCAQAGERQQFIANLLCAAGDRSGHLSVILTLRSDFLGHTQSHPDLNHAIASQGVIIPVMNDQELRAAIAEPARQAGHPLDDATIDLLIEQTKAREGALPLLQFALEQIWNGLAAGVSPADTLKQIGGVGGALAGKAQQIFDRLSDADKAIARRAFLGLIQLGEGARDTRRRISVAEIVAHGDDPAHVQAILNAFTGWQARLVTLSATPDGAETAEITHEALLDHWSTLKDWLDASRDDLRFHRHLAEDARYWATQNKPDGLLWRPPDLDLLQQYRQRAGQDMTPLQMEFWHASVRKYRQAKRGKQLAIAALLGLFVAATVAAGLAFRASQQVSRQSRFARIRSLIAYAYQDNAQAQRERAALLARHAALLNQQYHGNVQEEIDIALRTIFYTPFIAAEPYNPELTEQVCQKVKLKIALTPEEWREFTDNELPYQRACPELQQTYPLQLRREPMRTNNYMALSLNIADVGGWGSLAHDVENLFEDQDEVIFDRATMLMWQKSESPSTLAHSNANDYCANLILVGHDDWRLPTIEELLSLFEPERQTNKLYLNPIFSVVHYAWYWSADLDQAKIGDFANLAWGVDFRLGFVRSEFVSPGGICTRCVRVGQ